MKKLTITVWVEVYSGLHAKIMPDQITTIPKQRLAGRSARSRLMTWRTVDRAIRRQLAI